MSTLKIDTLIDVSREEAAQTPNSIDVDYLVRGSLKAWVHGGNDASLNSSLNVGSGTDHGTGDFSYTLSNNYNSTDDYCQSGAGILGTGAGHQNRNTSRHSASAMATETFTDTNTATTQADLVHSLKTAGVLA